MLVRGRARRNANGSGATAARLAPRRRGRRGPRPTPIAAERADTGIDTTGRARQHPHDPGGARRLRPPACRRRAASSCARACPSWRPAGPTRASSASIAAIVVNVAPRRRGADARRNGTAAVVVPRRQRGAGRAAPGGSAAPPARPRAELNRAAAAPITGPWNAVSTSQRPGCSPSRPARISLPTISPTVDSRLQVRPGRATVVRRHAARHTGRRRVGPLGAGARITQQMTVLDPGAAPDRRAARPGDRGRRASSR